jgi:hypothetical protein
MPITNEFDNLHRQAVTMKCHASLTYEAAAQHGTSHAGKAVEMSGQGEVRLVQTGNEVFGILEKIEPDGMATIQDEGYGEVPYTGTLSYTENDNGVIGGSTAGSVAIAAAAPAVGAVRTAKMIKVSDTAGKAYIKL